MILFFDTETTGFVDKRQPPEWPGQPHAVQLAALLTEDDGEERGVLSVIVNPGGDVRIPEAASNVHGITNAVAERCGVHPMAALGLFYRMAQQADLLVAHNLEFDLLLMQAEAHRAGQAVVVKFLAECKAFCTLEVAAPIVNLPPTERMLAAGFDKPKPPKLEEAYEHFTGEKMIGAHDALVDVRACRSVYFAIKELDK